MAVISHKVTRTAFWTLLNSRLLEVAYVHLTYNICSYPALLIIKEFDFIIVE
jgi:hypothetical protein